MTGRPSRKLAIRASSCCEGRQLVFDYDLVRRRAPCDRRVPESTMDGAEEARSSQVGVRRIGVKTSGLGQMS